MPLGKVQSQIVANLVGMDVLTSMQAEALAARPEDLSGSALDRLLQSEYRVTHFQSMVAMGRALGMAPINAARCRVTPSTYERIPQEFCEKNHVLPIGMIGEILLVAVANPFDDSLQAKIQELAGRRIVRLLAREKDIKEKFGKGPGSGAGFAEVVRQIGAEFGTAADVAIPDSEVSEASGPIIQLASRIIEEAYYAGASDVHVEPWETEMIVRYRIDGVCVEKLRLPAKSGPALVARLKIMCNLDIAERRLPQDGRIIFKNYTRSGLDIDLRVSTAPLNHGEGVVMRILDKQKTTLPMTALGFSPENLERYRACIRQPYGMILHCGPTGSGKSMTLYSALNEVNTPDVVIRTAEDPIEYTLPGINQMQMHRQIGLTFATALRAFLRQDPDIILVGEIRDTETASIAIEAALTGHLLISTLHTNDAASTVARLTDMEIEPFMISASLLCVCAQRLMRRVCKQCKIPHEPKGREKEILEKGIGWSGTIFRNNPRGCLKCGGNGFKGRTGIHELMTSSEELVEAINRKSESADIKRIAVRSGMKTLHQDSLLKVREGTSTLEEALATVPVDM